MRCHQRREVTFSAGVNLIVGDNGSGKTTILEAAHLLVFGRSFRQTRDPELVRWGDSSFSIAGRWQRFGPVLTMAQGSAGKVRLTLQGQAVRNRRDVVAVLPLLVDAPQGERLVDGASNERRRWLDRLVISLREQLEGSYRDYLRAVMQRNRLLRQRGSAAELAAWEQQIVEHGLPILRQRITTIEQLNPLLHAEQSLSEQLVELRLLTTTPERGDEWLALLAARRESDRQSGGLRIGPHCDGVELHLGGREIRKVGSRGQQRLAAVALRLAQWQLLANQRGIAPLLLFDDCLEALDSRRQAKMIERLCATPGQILLTAPNAVTEAKVTMIRCL